MYKQVSHTRVKMIGRDENGVCLVVKDGEVED